MADLALQFGGDLSVSPSGDLLLAGGSLQTQQRILRRLLTNPGDYIWHPGYGAGLGQYVGEPGAPAAIAGTVKMQMLRETSVAKSPAPSVSAAMADDGTLTLSLSYTEAATQQTSALTLTL